MAGSPARRFLLITICLGKIPSREPNQAFYILDAIPRSISTRDARALIGGAAGRAEKVSRSPRTS